MSKPTGLENLTVLAVDDSQHMRQLLKTLLSAFGVKNQNILEAEDGEEAYTKLKQKPIDLILTDLVMQPVDGIEFIQKVRNGKDSPDPFVPIIVVSGYTEEYRVSLARDCGCTEVLAKPVSAKELAVRIHSCIDNPRPFVRTKTYFGPDRRRHKEEDVAYEGVERRRSMLAQQPDGEGS